MKIEWEEKSTYEEEIDIQEIINYAKENNLQVHYVATAMVVVRQYLQEYGNYPGPHPEEIIQQVAGMLLKAIEEQKVTLAQIAEMIDDLICYLQPQQFFPEAINKKSKILELVHKYKNQE